MGFFTPKYTNGYWIRVPYSKIFLFFKDEKGTELMGLYYRLDYKQEFNLSAF